MQYNLLHKIIYNKNNIYSVKDSKLIKYELVNSGKNLHFTGFNFRQGCNKKHFSLSCNVLTDLNQLAIPK